MFELFIILWLVVGVVSVLWLTWLDGFLQAKDIPLAVLMCFCGPVALLTKVLAWCAVQGNRYVWTRKEK